MATPPRLGLTEELLVDFAMCCGNDFITESIKCKMPDLRIDLSLYSIYATVEENKGIPQLREFLFRETSLNNIPISSANEEAQEKIDHSRAFYNGPPQEDPPPTAPATAPASPQLILQPTDYAAVPD